MDDTLLIPDDSVVCISKDPLPDDLGKFAFPYLPDPILLKQGTR